MNQLSIDFVHTRHRRTDPQTSRDAARAALSSKRQAERHRVYDSLFCQGPATGKELALRTGMTFTEVSRCLSEIGGIARTGKKREGSAEWAVAA